MDGVKIWGKKIPYNTGKIKKNDLLLSRAPMVAVMFKWFKDVFGTKITKDSRWFDTYTYRAVIKKGKESQNYDDEPVIYSYPVKESDIAVVIAPGGAFCYKDMEKEGHAVARELNKKGISCFVLDYRLHPYKAPVCYLDMQRAIRYVRHNAEQYGLKISKIGSLGFSAGGYVAGAEAIFLENQPVSYEGYIPDDIDKENGKPDFIGMIYPVTNFDVNPNMLCLLAGEDFFDAKKRTELQKQYSLIENVHENVAPQFICYGTKDFLKGMNLYAEKVKMLTQNSKELIIDGAQHGFSMNKKYSYWIDEFVEWTKNI